MGKFVILKLKKGEETQEITMKTDSMMDMSKKALKLSKLNRAGWQLVECTGNDAAKVEMFNRVAKGYVPDTKEMLKFSGLPAIPNPLKKLFKKKEPSDQARGKEDPGAAGDG
jgi:hypothetical protein